jgi:DNA-binding transcriptional ArsR family regulator/Fe-S-cluster formation regulator IscX/YfhJ
MAAPNRKKIDRPQIYRAIVRMIQESSEGEVEVSSSELADTFGVQSPTMDYHLNKLVDDGSLSLSPKRGRYNRKIYRLPASAKQDEKPTLKINEDFSPAARDKFKDFISQHEKKQIQEHATSTNDIQEEFPFHAPAAPEVEEEVQEKIETPESQPVHIEELSLDAQIQNFLKEVNMIGDAEELLQHEDREILSVMNETLNQTTVYLKDLSDQLSTIQNKKLIQSLIDERNRTQKQMERLEDQVEEARQMADQTVEKYEVDPNRVRFMHQLIISTVDNFVNQPNHALALGRTDFRNKISKEVQDLVKYVLHLED